MRPTLPRKNFYQVLCCSRNWGSNLSSPGLQGLLESAFSWLALAIGELKTAGHFSEADISSRLLPSLAGRLS
ncbi:MAG: hypothetical protein ACK55I_49355, partial [bacterium]